MNTSKTKVFDSHQKSLISEKKGVSQVVTTILIILLVIAAVMIVWQVVENIIEAGGDTVSKKSGCVGLDIDIVDGSCTGGGSAGSITISRGGDSVDGTALTVTTTNSAGSSESFTGTLDVLGSAVIDTTLTSGSYGSSTTVNTGITLSDGETICSGATEVIQCT